jgi:hypothetical protein
MQDTDLFLSLAEIAGVFVGFGALISVRSSGASDAHEVAYIRPVVTLAICVVVAALAPVIISRYGVTGHELWLVCSLVALCLLRLDCRAWTVHRLPARLVTTPQTVQSFTRESSIGWLARSIRLRCYA